MNKKSKSVSSRRSSLHKKVGDRSVRIYSNLAQKRRIKKDDAARKKAQYLATLPKHPLKRLLYRLHPKRVIKYWFSKDGLKMSLKILLGLIIALVLIIGGLFAYYRKDLDAIRPSEIEKRVRSTVTTYLDRNGKVLWEDKGTGNYTLVVKSDEINTYVKEATVAIEDKDFYNHNGVSLSGLARAFINNTQGGSTQGGSTLTQQLVKQVFFSAEEASERGLAGIPRKIKEMILAIEVERMYNKDQILTLYLNESSYGGRRNGVESGAQTYFHKSAKDLTLAESALLAAIPNSPAVYNPYNTDGHAALLERQHKVLNSMVEMSYITQAQADEAKKVAILDTIQPASGQMDGVVAPHFVTMVKDQLEAQLGSAVVGNGGLTIKTTLDIDTQNRLQAAIDDMFKGKLGYQECGGNCPAYTGFRNGAAAVEDNQTGQIIALVGSKDFNESGYGENNAATSFLQPGSSIKPLVYAQLFQKQSDGKANWGAGSILSDTKTSFSPTYTPNNADLAFLGNITIRESLDRSRNIPAIKAMQVSGVDQTLATIRAMGDKDYCTVGVETDAGLPSAIGSCGTRLIDHVNAMASLGRLGAYLPQTTILEATNSNGESLLKYSASTPTQVVDPQAAYIVNDILSDNSMRLKLLSSSSLANINSKGIKAAVKTGTSDISINGKPYSKDLWAVGYTPSLSMAVWLGNPDNTPLITGRGNSRIPMYILDKVLADTTVAYKSAGKIVSDTWARPTGIQTINGDIYPSYFNKANAPQKSTMDFDKISKKKATDCTPALARESIEVMKVTDPVTNKEIVTSPTGYNADENDTAHSCSDVKPTVVISINNTNGTATVTYGQGTFALQTIEIAVDGTVVKSKSISGSDTWSAIPLGITSGDKHTITATVTDTGYYQATDTDTYIKP